MRLFKFNNLHALRFVKLIISHYFLSIRFRPVFAFSYFACVFFSACQSDNKSNHAPENLLDRLPQLPAPDAQQSARVATICRHWYDTSLVATGFNGGMLVAKHGHILFEAYQGTARLDGKDSVGANTAFHIASASKTFTAMAVLHLWQQNKLQLDDLFSAYFPKFNYPGVTIRTLLNHRSGLPNYVYFMQSLGWDLKKYVTNNDVLDFLITKKKALENIGRPDAAFVYCNTNYVLLALLIEKVSGKKYADYLADIFFTPLQMNNTFVFDTSLAEKVTPSFDYRGLKIPFNHLDAVYGDKNIYSTPRDLLQWDRLLNTDLIFSSNTRAEAFKGYSYERPGVRNYGLGWRMFDFPNGKKIVYHNGWWHGNNAVFLRAFQDGGTIILLGNRYNKNTYHARDLIGLFGDYGPVDAGE